MFVANRRLGISLAIASLVLVVAAYCCSRRAGLIFDSKQGIGDIDAATSWSMSALSAVVLSWLSASIAVPLIVGPTIWRVVGSLLFFSMLVLPIGLLAVLAGEAAGVQATGP